MDVIHGLDQVKLSGVVLTIGNFDGVHRGHQAILAAGRRRADAAGAPLVVMTFDPHPLAILTPEHVPARLTPLEEKLRCLAQSGADATVVVESTRDFLNVTAETFITEFIVGRFRPIALIEGASFGFGRQRQGDVSMLATAAAAQGFDLEVVEPVRLDLGGQPGAVISSSLVRQLIRSGDVADAARALDRPYTLLGRVTRGASRGKDLGFPTANIFAPNQLIPAEGVYAGLTEVDEHRHPTAVSIGRNPTFGGGDLIVEAHLLDFDGDLYDRTLRLEFLAWIREQCTFASTGDLHRQITTDVQRIRNICARHT